MFTFARFTDNARRAFKVARGPGKLPKERVDCHAVLLALIDLRRSLAGELIRSGDLDAASLKTALHAIEAPPGANGLEIVAEATRQARQLGQNHVGTEHLLLASIRLINPEGAKVLAEHGIDEASTRERLRALHEAPERPRFPLFELWKAKWRGRSAGGK